MTLDLNFKKMPIGSSFVFASEYIQMDRGRIQHKIINSSSRPKRISKSNKYQINRKRVFSYWNEFIRNNRAQAFDNSQIAITKIIRRLIP
ncbi:MAG: hypothetical protein L0H53_17035 [Candidatus Nitrosocosmicus sp.]|nr:hypothetical protein [Candidatus Nitrosocosmicus sp.]MDN5867901.1 hypothetical protein [Candidatus Nitrosocosmicus sp.]